jgi:hypothetical protein
MRRSEWWSRGLSLAAFVVAFSVAGSSSGFASTIIKADIPTLQRMSESVVHARVVDIQSSWNAEGTMIFTHVTLEVIRTLHGTSEPRIVVRVPGGSVAGFTVQMPGAPEFSEGNVVAFIGSWDDGVPRVVGYFQGLARVVPDRLGNLILQGGAANGLPISELVRQLGQQGRAGGNR